MSIVELKIDDPTPVYFYDYQVLNEEVETTLGVVKNLSALIAENKQLLERKAGIEKNPDLQRLKNQQKMAQTALFIGELYVLYVLSFGLSGHVLQSYSFSLGNSVFGVLTAMASGLLIGRSSQLFFGTFYDHKLFTDCHCDSYNYDNIRYEATALLKTMEARVHLFEQKYGEETKPLSLALKEKLNQTSYQLLHQFPHPALILGK